MLPDDPRHGSEAGYEQHVRDDEDPCDPCHTGKILAGRRRNKRKTMGYRYTVPAGPARARMQSWRDAGATYGEMADHAGIEESRAWELVNEDAPVIYTRTSKAVLGAEGWPVTRVGITRRVRALCRLGWSIPRIAEACGVNHDTILFIRKRQPEFLSRKVRNGIIAGYALLADKLPTGATQQERAGITRARNYAERNGWPSPWAYEDIDDPNDPADEMTYRPPTRAEMVSDLDDRGAGVSEVCRVLGITPNALEKWCERRGDWETFKRLRAREYTGQEYRNQWTKERSA